MGILDIYFAPSKVFAALREKPRWILPLAVVLVVVALTAVLTVNLAREEITMRQEEVMRDRGLTEEQMDQARQFTSSPVAVISGALSAAIFTIILLLVFAVVTNLFVPLFGGESGFKKIFSVICFSSLVIIPAAILKLIMIAITKSPYVTTSLALFVPALARDSFMYQLLAGFDFFIIWEMILVSIGISITSGIARKNAYVLVFVIWFVSVFVGIGLGRIFGRGM
ncbi:MAG: YIP1 family protein [candidate division WOR-3 bacterium]|nr:MAG: YIP1 family protein [candidate division WOR-3 bacterium]